MEMQELLKPTKQQILVVDERELIFKGTIKILSWHDRSMVFLTAETEKEISERFNNLQGNVVFIDIYLPQITGITSTIDTGIKLTQESILKDSPLNLMMQIAYLKAIVEINQEIDRDRDDFTIADTNFSEKEMLIRVNWILPRETSTKELKTVLKLKQEWIEVLRLASEGFQDRAIAERTNIHARTVRHYWTKIQNALDVYPEDGKNLRILTLKRAREEGLID
jgi:DNA-binding NarL/FixJ family response regulator